MTNVLLIYADDMRFDFLPYMPTVQNLLVKPGRTFTQARCNVGLCGPSRAGLLTGQWSIHSGLLAMGDLPDHNATIGDWMQEKGYRTGLIGKYLNAAKALTPKPTGWATWRQLLTNDQSQYGFEVHDGTTTALPASSQMHYLETEAQAFIAGAEPWFLMLTPSSPHHPFNPLPDDLFDWSHVKWPIVLETAANSTDMPAWIANAEMAPDPSDVPSFQDAARGQLRELNGLDRMIGSLIAGMAPSVLANTVIIFSSDNGLYYGEHRNYRQGFAKADLYDVSLRVPLVIKGPGVAPGVSNEMVSMGADLTKTVAFLGGARPPLEMEEPNACNLLDVINRPGDFADRAVLSSKEPGLSLPLTPNPNSGNCITTPTRKLMRWDVPLEVESAVGSGIMIPNRDRYEAYDLDTDPDELRNWANDGSRSVELRELETQLDDLLSS